MTVLLLLFTFVLFLVIDHCKTALEHRSHDRVYRSEPRGSMFTTPGFEALGAFAQDGGEPSKEPKKLQAGLVPQSPVNRVEVEVRDNTRTIF